MIGALRRACTGYGIRSSGDSVSADASEGEASAKPLFAATRLLFGTPSGWCQFRHVLRENEDAIRAIMLKRSTQTNEPARCATLLPVLARLPQPLALIEVGASAGLCLMADRYGYDYGRGSLVRPSVDQLDPPVFSCVVNATTPVPTAPPRVTWRAGLDLDPVDISDPNQAAWLEALVWPEQSDRLAKLRTRREMKSRPIIILRWVFCVVL